MLKLSQIPQKYFDLIETIFSDFDGALIIDEKGIIKVFTDYYAQETGYEKYKVIGKKVDEVFPNTRMLEVLNSGNPIIADKWEVQGKSQIVSRVPITDNGQIIGAAGFNVFRYLNDARGFAHRLSHLYSELEYYKKEVQKLSSAKYSLASIIGQSDVILEAKERVKIAAQCTSPVLITGETGTGKELFAHAIHQESPRREYPLIKVNCATIPENLLETELFGYEEGAFTGARKRGKPGKFELANRGSIFLDEIAELSPAAQAKLLRVVQEQELEKVGGTDTIPIDVRIISATNVPLNKLVNEGKFRKDLFFRLDVIPIFIPPLRERLDDIKILSDHFIDTYNLESGGRVDGVDNSVLRILNSYHWPGNVRELNTAVERACIDAQEGILTKENLLRFASNKHIPELEVVYKGFDLEKAKEEAEKATIMRALKSSGGNKTRAARLLGLSRSTLYNKIKKNELLKY